MDRVVPYWCLAEFYGHACTVAVFTYVEAQSPQRGSVGPFDGHPGDLWLQMTGFVFYGQIEMDNDVQEKIVSGAGFLLDLRYNAIEVLKSFLGHQV